MKTGKFSYTLRVLGSVLMFFVCVNCGNCKKKKDSCQSAAQCADAACAISIKNITDEEFGAFISKEGTALVFFSKETCPKCVPVTELLNEIAAENGEKYVMGKIDAANSASSTASCGVTATPTIIIYKNGEEVARFEGAVEKAVIVDALNK